MMALTRCLIIKNALNPKFEFFSKPLYALLSMFIAFVLSTILTILFWSRYELVEVKAWTPPLDCTGFPPGYTVPRYKSSMDDAWLLKPMLSLQIFSVIDGLIKIIPTLMFPILTIILVRELKKAAASRRNASVGSEKHEENSKSHQATKLVILMTITYMAAEGPLGIIYVVQGFVTQPPGIVSQIGEQPVDIMIIGCEPLADMIQNSKTLPYSQIRGFPESKINDKNENLIFGELGGKNVVCVQGRLDKNEHNMDLALCALPVRVMQLLGAKIMIVSNAAVSINGKHKRGDLMVIKDHIFLPGLAGWSPLNGCGDERYGSPFVPVHDAYDKELRKLAIEVARENNRSLQEGIFTMTGGPQLETTAELRLLRKFGADVVGTSTCHEVTVARHCGVKVLGFAWIVDSDSDDALDAFKQFGHEELEFFVEIIKEIKI
ncbi:hypothetical protein B9Z55_017319 [Caenorhabditis nigoni]|nr:hypothetical protein B9Z55_017319 [Caenorhabditis nigoni]